MRFKHQHSKTFFAKTQIVLALLTIIPFLLVVYLFVSEKIDLTERITLFAPLALLSVLSGFSLIRKSAEQLRHLATETGMVEAGEKTEPVRIKADKEMNDIAEHFNAILKKFQETDKDMRQQSIQLMVYARDLALSYKETKEEEELRNRLSRYVGKNLVEKLIRLKDGVFLENERKEVTVLFADIRSFTSLAEKMRVEDVISMLNQFFGIMVDIVFRNNGVLDKLVGDQLMAVFGLISSDNSCSHSAVKAAIEMQNAVEELMKVRAEEGKVTFEIGIGVNTGNAIVGNVGAENRMDYTVIGDSVNIAARLEGMARGGEIVVGEQTFHQTQGRFNIQKRGEIYVKNKTEPITCYNVLR